MQEKTEASLLIIKLSHKEAFKSKQGQLKKIKFLIFLTTETDSYDTHFQVLLHLFGLDKIFKLKNAHKQTENLIFLLW